MIMIERLSEHRDDQAETPEQWGPYFRRKATEIGRSVSRFVDYITSPAIPSAALDALKKFNAGRKDQMTWESVEAEMLSAVDYDREVDQSKTYDELLAEEGARDGTPQLLASYMASARYAGVPTIGEENRREASIRQMLDMNFGWLMDHIPYPERQELVEYLRFKHQPKKAA